jgi:hypothetical protein
MTAPAEDTMFNAVNVVVTIGVKGDAACSRAVFYACSVGTLLDAAPSRHTKCVGCTLAGMVIG